MMNVTPGINYVHSYMKRVEDGCIVMCVYGPLTALQVKRQVNCNYYYLKNCAKFIPGS